MTRHAHDVATRHDDDETHAMLANQLDGARAIRALRHDHDALIARAAHLLRAAPPDQVLTWLAYAGGAQ